MTWDPNSYTTPTQQPVVLVKQESNSIEYTPTTETGMVHAGDVAFVGDAPYVAHRDIYIGEQGEIFSLSEKPQYAWPKDGSPISAGEAIYWHTTGSPVGGTGGTGAVNNASTGGDATYVGTAPYGAEAGDATVILENFPAASVSNTIQTQLEDVIADPGNAGAIPITASGHVEIVTAAAETRTIAAPSFLGELLLVSAKTVTSSNTCTITIATGIDEEGDTTLVLDTAGQAVLLVAKAVGTNIRWSLVSADGVRGYTRLSHAIADPGDTNAIPVATTGHVDIVTTGAQTRSLGAPTYAGQQLLLSCKTHVGDATITCATTVNASGNDTVVLSAAGQAILLTAKVSGSNPRWMVAANDGATLSTAGD